MTGRPKTESVYQDVSSLIAAATYTLHALADMTSEQFARGKDSSARHELAKALGYADYHDWFENEYTPPT